MNGVFKTGSVVIIALLAAACSERNVTDAPRANDARSIFPSFTALPGAQVAVNFEPLEVPPWYLPGPINAQ
ncbi:MAG TPA: hypothetical protein VF836_06740, partial [Gemmatimonadaceae bacterium]